MSRLFSVRALVCAKPSFLTHCFLLPLISFTEHYYPIRVTSDAFFDASGVQGAVKNNIHKDGYKQRPSIAFVGSEGLVIGRDLTNITHVVAPGYNHLDVLSASRKQNLGRTELVSTGTAKFISQVSTVGSTAVSRLTTPLALLFFSQHSLDQGSLCRRPDLSRRTYSSRVTRSSLPLCRVVFKRAQYQRTASSHTCLSYCMYQYKRFTLLRCAVIVLLSARGDSPVVLHLISRRNEDNCEIDRHGQRARTPLPQWRNIQCDVKTKITHSAAIGPFRELQAMSLSYNCIAHRMAYSKSQN